MMHGVRLFYLAHHVTKCGGAQSPVKLFSTCWSLAALLAPLLIMLKNRQKQFVIDGEAVILGVDGVSDFEALRSGRHNEEVQLYAFDMLAGDGDDMRSLPLSRARPILPDCWHGALMASSSHRSNRARSAPTYFAPRAKWGWRAIMPGLRWSGAVLIWLIARP